MTDPCLCGCTDDQKLSQTQIARLASSLERAGFYIWAGLVERDYPSDPKRWNHLWNTLPSRYRRWWWRWKPV